MPVNVVPERLTAFRVYLNGATDLAGVADIQLPSIENLSETVKGAGIAGEYESPTVGHFGSMVLTLNWRAISKDMLKTLRQKAQRFDCRGAFQDYEAAAGEHKIRQCRVVVQGITKKVDPGKFETGSPSDASTEIEVLYLKIGLDGKTVVEIDKLNYVCIVDGVDYLAEVRKALGL